MTFVTASFISLQQGVSDNFVRQAEVQDAQGAMVVISRDVRAIADDQGLQIPLITTMAATILVAAVNVDTTANAIAGAASAFSGCPDEVTISGSAVAGPITETRTHPDHPATTVCAWTPSAANTFTTIIAPNAELGLLYLTSSGGPSALASTTASIQITVTVPPSGPTSAVTPITIVQTTPLATFSGVQAAAGS